MLYLPLQYSIQRIVLVFCDNTLYMQYETVRKEIDLHKRYNFPEYIYEIPHNGKWLIISRETANWIVLENDRQVSFYHLLKLYPIQEAMRQFDGSVSDVQHVLLQLEARHFEDKTVIHYHFDFSLHLYLTNACNLRCPHCYLSAGIKCDNELTTEEIFDLLRNFKTYGGTNLVLSGGEICVRTDLENIIKYGKSLGLHIKLLTNGTLWDKEKIDVIAPLINQIQISIDGYSEDTNAKVRGKGNFQKALDTVDAFVKKNIFTEVAITPLYQNDYGQDANRYAEFGKSLLTKYKGYLFDVKFTGEILDGRDIKLTNAQKQHYLKISERIFTDCYGDISSVPFILAHRNKELSENCSFGNLAVASNGNVYLCAAIPNISAVANIRSTSFEKIAELRKTAFVKSNVNNLMPCRECALKYICGGECRVTHFKEFETDMFITHNHYPTRKCDEYTKKKYLDLMLKTNESLFQ